MFSFEKLEVWKKSKALVVKLYTLTRQFPKSEKFGLVSQIQRAAVSVPANIAEGISRFSNKEKIRFIEIAYGSNIEVVSHLYISKDLGFITLEQLESLKPELEEIAKMLSGLRKSFLHQ